MHTRELAKRGALVIGGVAIAVLVAELLLRLIGYSRPPLLVAHEVRGFGLRPNTRVVWTSEGNAVVEINRVGFRDVNHTHAKPRGVFRVAVLGDSFAEALQVPLDSTFWKRLERELPRCLPAGLQVEALNFGVSGYGTAQQLLTYRTEARSYDPDLVLLAVMPTNDVRDNSSQLTASNDLADPRRRPEDPRRQRPFFVLEADTLRLDTTFRQSSGTREQLYAFAAMLAARSRIAQLAWDARRRWTSPESVVPVAGRETGLNVEVYRPPVTREWQDAWQLTDALIGALQRDVERDSAQLVVVTLSQGIQVHPDPEVTRTFMANNGVTHLFYPDERVREIGQARGVPVIMLAPGLQRYARSTRTFLHGFYNTQLGSGHWNSAGHRVAAAIVTSRLCPLLRDQDVH